MNTSSDLRYIHTWSKALPPLKALVSSSSVSEHYIHAPHVEQVDASHVSSNKLALAASRSLTFCEQFTFQTKCNVLSPSYCILLSLLTVLGLPLKRCS